MEKNSHRYTKSEYKYKIEMLLIFYCRKNQHYINPLQRNIVKGIVRAYRRLKFRSP